MLRPSLAALLMATTAFAGEIGFLEEYSLGRDRAAALRQLIPGTEDYYYYHALHALNTQQYEKAKSYFPEWYKRFNQTPRLTEIQTRLALMTYETDPKATLEYLKNHFHIHFNHSKEVLGAVPDYANKFDNNAITRQAMMQRYNSGNLHEFEDSALDWLANEKLTNDQRRIFLQRLTRPDLPNLVSLVADDLAHVNSGGFGSINIHRQMTKAQLDDLLKRRPDLQNQTNYVNTVISKLHPNADDNWRQDRTRLNAYLERLLAYVRTLNGAHNSLKANVFYHKLLLDRSQGRFEKELFVEYLKLPRNMGYMSKKSLESDEARRFPGNLGIDFSNVTMLAAVHNDEVLVRAYLKHFFATADSWKEFEAYVNDVYLKYAYAETKIELGLGEPEKWAADLPPELFAQLKERIDIDFAATNRTHYGVNEAVSLELDVKNVSTLLVKVFEINTVNYYRDNQREIDTDINLDGLVPNFEKTHTYNDPPLLRKRRAFEFPELNKPGVYVIDFIGSGKSSRALVRKGKLRPLVRTGTAGQIISIVDEKNAPVTDASVWLGGTEYAPDKDGTVLVPFSTAPSRQPIVLRRGEFASLDYLDHQAEGYRLLAGIHVDREQLLTQRLATVLVRPQLKINDQPVSLKLLEKPRLRIHSIDTDGIQSTTEVPLEMSEDAESKHEFRVPPRLMHLSFTLLAKVKSLSTNAVLDLADSHSVSLNGLTRTNQMADVQFARMGNGFILEYLGRTGEPKADKPITVTVKHRDFRETYTQMLKTDANGRIDLGELKEIVWVRANGPNEAGHTWVIPTDQYTFRRVIDARAGETVKMPWLTSTLTRLDAAFFEVTDRTVIADRFENLKLNDGVLEIAGLTPGDFELIVKASGDRIRIRVVDGVLQSGYVLGALRHLEMAKLTPVAISGITSDAETVTIKFKDLSTLTRVHIIASRYQPEYSAYHDLAKIRDRELGGVYPGTAESVYLTGRAIGDEFRYVLDRRYQKKYPGNMLDRPQLLLNPWAVRSTETGEQMAQAGDSFGTTGRADPARPAATPPAEPKPGDPRGPAAPDQSTFMDYLKTGSVLLPNLVPENNMLVIKKPAFGPHQFLTIVVVDPVSTAVRHLALPEQNAEKLDLRLLKGLDPKAHFTQQKTVTILEKGKPFTLADASGGRFEAIDSMPKLFALYGTLLKDPRLAEFEFLARWPSLKDDEKRSFYSKYACHEVSFFIAKRDPEFFKAVVLPYLANKRDKTFVDEWLLARDVSGYAAPWKHGRMNVAEQVLFSQRMPNEPAKTARHLSDLFRLMPRNIEREVLLFDTTLSTGSMDGENGMLRFKQEELDKAALTPVLRSPNPPTAVYGNFSGGAVAPGNAAPAAKPAMDAAKSERGERELKGKAMEEQAKKMDDAKKEVEKSYARRATTRGGEAKDGKNYYYEEDRAAGRKLAEQLYRRLEPTMEWAENNYYKLPIQSQLAGLVNVNPFWIDYANHANGPFLSKNIAYSCTNLTEVLLALAVTELPFEAGKHEMKFENGAMVFTPAGAAIAFHEEVRPSAAPPANATILVNQNFYKADDRYRDENGERSEKFVNAEFVINTVYGCQVVVTNPTPARQKLAVLLQVPVGSLPLAGGKPTRTVLLDLEPYRTQTIDYTFYFPAAGQYAHFPVHVAKNETLAAAAAPFTFNVVPKPTKLDTESWDYISQNGTGEQVIAYLERESIAALNLDRIAWRMQDAAFYKQTIALLQARHIYQNTLWSYSVMHNDLPSLREYLQHFDLVANECGGPLVSPAVSFDPVQRYAYEHLEYKPLVNARAHSLGSRRQIVNDRFHGQYHHFLKMLSYRTALSDEDSLAVAYYLLLQDRIDDAGEFFKSVKKENVNEQMQYDYCAAYLAMSNGDAKAARAVAEKHAAHPVDRWRNVFANVINQCDEIDGKAVKLTDAENRDARQAELAAKAPSFDFNLDNKQINLNTANIESATINYYLMDVELLFSRNPFVQQTGGQFAMIKPNLTKTVKLEAGKNKFSLPLPEEFLKKNVLVEINAGGKTRSLPYYANAMDVKISDSYGQLKVTDAGGKALSKVYVKVYLKNANGEVKFHKDGYTDLRGRFDYASVSTPERSPPAKFSLLILSDEHGAVIREVNPPQQ